jgi:cell filamentation protein
MDDAVARQKPFPDDNRAELVAEAVHSVEMEGGVVTEATRADLADFARGVTDYAALLAAVTARHPHGPAPTASESTADNPDPYSDPDTGVLRNLLGLADRERLAEAEGDLSAARLVGLTGAPIKATRDLDEFRAIHRWLFGDVYGWAGHIRTVDIRKNVPGAQPFLPVSMIARSAGYIAQELADDRFLQDLSRSAFVERLAHHYDQWNYIHPFREGNGRTQRAFWGRVAHDAGWVLIWAHVSQQTNDAASRAASETGDLAKLLTMFDRIVSHQ